MSTNLPKYISNPENSFRCSTCKSVYYKACRTCPVCENSEQKPTYTVCLVCRHCDVELEKLNACVGEESTTDKYFSETNTRWTKYIPLETEILSQHYSVLHNTDIMQTSPQMCPSSTSSPITPPTPPMNTSTTTPSTSTTITKQEAPVVENKLSSAPPSTSIPSMSSTAFKPHSIVTINQKPQSIPNLSVGMNAMSVPPSPLNPKVTLLGGKPIPVGVTSHSIPTIRNMMVPPMSMLPFSIGPPVRPPLPVALMAKNNAVNTVNKLPTVPSSTTISSPKNSSTFNQPIMPFLPKPQNMDISPSPLLIQNTLAEQSQKIIQNAELFVRLNEQALVKAKLKDKVDDLVAKVKAKEITVQEFFESFQHVRSNLSVMHNFVPNNIYQTPPSVLLTKHGSGSYANNVVKTAQSQQAKEILRQTAIQALSKAKASNVPLESQNAPTTTPMKSPVKLLNPAIAPPKQFLIRITQEKIISDDPTVRIELRNHPKMVEEVLSQFSVCKSPEEQAELLSKHPLLQLIVENLYKYIVNNKLDTYLSKKNEFSKIKQESDDDDQSRQEQDFDSMEDEEEANILEEKYIKQEENAPIDSKQPIILDDDDDDEYAFGMNEIEVCDTKSTIQVVPDWQPKSSSSAELESALFSLSNLAAVAEEQESSFSTRQRGDKFKESKTVNTRKRDKRDSTFTSLENARKRTRSTVQKEQEGQKNPLLMLTNIATKMLEDAEKCK